MVILPTLLYACETLQFTNGMPKDWTTSNILENLLGLSGKTGQMSWKEQGCRVHIL